MTLDQVASLSQIMGAVGVIASLIFVGLQIMDNSKAVRSATAQAVHDNYAGWYISLSGNESALATSAKGFVDLSSLSPAEKAQFVCTMMAFLSRSQNAFHQWKEGHLSDGLWAGWEALMMNLVNTPGGAAFWGERGYVFGEEFQDHVAAIMKRQPDPRAKAFGVVPVTHVTAQVSESAVGE
jgi:hypothetical protein